ncbi:hypothetical protein SMAC4_13760 [Sordaria macrospora]|uniref:uncharacterized protein n=1 Tax=Sordaria macrospora TaxID=5147 RepID=UPI002B2856AD|nr:hypothetical protein SMAC4_13760 [Sordaria macrospora]
MLTKGFTATSLTPHGLPRRPTSLQTAAQLALPFLRPILQPPVYNGDTHKDPETTSKDRAAKDFKEWLLQLDSSGIVVYTDGSMIAKQMDLPAHAEDPEAEEDRPESECVAFGYVIFQGQTELGRGCGQLEKVETHCPPHSTTLGFLSHGHSTIPLISPRAARLNPKPCHTAEPQALPHGWMSEATRLHSPSGSLFLQRHNLPGISSVPLAPSAYSSQRHNCRLHCLHARPR